MNNETFFHFFLNKTQIRGFKGFLGYGIRELNSNESQTLCYNTSSSKLISPPQITYQVNFSSDFILRAFSSGCYYYDVPTGKWSSDGVEILNDTDTTSVHCFSSHLTSFAGGLVVLPSAINFEYVWANASFIQNPIIYSTVIVITCLYILLAIIARVMDIKDRKKLNILPLSDNSPHDNYFYEIITFTGMRPDSGTDSKVGFGIVFK